MKQLLIATHNPAKKNELRGGFQQLTQIGVQLVFLDDLSIADEPIESGKTFRENAQLKAEFFGYKSGLPTIADDGGIEIGALNGEPGVKSKRWLNKDSSDQELIEHTLKRLENVPQTKRSAKLTLCLCYFNPKNEKIHFVTESIHGHIAFKSSNLAKPGFPYRALFVVDNYQKYYDELTSDEHLKINHRLQAVKKIIPVIEKDLHYS